LRSATWGDLARFFVADRWREVRRTGDIRSEKESPDGELLRSKRPSGKTDETIGPDLFREILRLQLRVSVRAFWQCVDSGLPVDRPSRPLPDRGPSLPAWLGAALERELGLRAKDLIGMTEEEARNRLLEHWSRSRPT
jgi:hypothetical protein